MRTAKSIAFAATLALAISTNAFAKSGTISGTSSGTISGTRTGTISGTRTGTISGTRTGTISGTSRGIIPTAPTTEIDYIKFGVWELLMSIKVW